YQERSCNGSSGPRPELLRIFAGEGLCVRHVHLAPHATRVGYSIGPAGVGYEPATSHHRKPPSRPAHNGPAGGPKQRGERCSFIDSNSSTRSKPTHPTRSMRGNSRRCSAGSTARSPSPCSTPSRRGTLTC